MMVAEGTSTQDDEAHQKSDSFMNTYQSACQQLGVKAVKWLLDPKLGSQGPDVIDLSGKQIGDLGALALSRALVSVGRFAKVRVLDLWSNELGPRTAFGVGQLLKSNFSLRKLLLKYNQLADEGAVAIASALNENYTLTTLDLEMNEIGPEGGQALAHAFIRNRSLTSVHLGSNHIGDDGARLMSEMLKVNKNLTSLNLSNNEITDASSDMLSQGLTSNTTLTHFYIKGNYLTDKRATEICVPVRRNLASHEAKQSSLSALETSSVEHRGASFASDDPKVSGQQSPQDPASPASPANVTTDSAGGVGASGATAPETSSPAPLGNPAVTQPSVVSPSLQNVSNIPLNTTTDTTQVSLITPNTLVLERYRIKTPLPHHGKCSLYYAEDMVSGQQVVVKVFKDRHPYQQEVNALVDLHSDYVVGMLDNGADRQGLYYIVMERGFQTLRSIVTGHQLIPVNVHYVVQKLMELVGFLASKGFTHTEIEPSKILRFEDSWKVVGLDAAVPSGQEFRVGCTQPFYAPPEYAKALVFQKPIITAHPSSMLWSLGMCIFELLSPSPLADVFPQEAVLHRLAFHTFYPPLHTIRDTLIRASLETLLLFDPRLRRMKPKNQ